MTPEDRIIPEGRADQTQKMNEQYKRIEVGIRIARPQEVFEKVYKGKEWKVFVIRDEDGMIRSDILNTKYKALIMYSKNWGL